MQLTMVRLQQAQKLCSKLSMSHAAQHCHQQAGIKLGLCMSVAIAVQGYGSKGIAEIPGNATLELDVELLSIKSSPFGSRVKVVEG